jgi:hypothetical protein
VAYLRYQAAICLVTEKNHNLRMRILGFQANIETVASIISSRNVNNSTAMFGLQILYEHKHGVSVKLLNLEICSSGR